MAGDEEINITDDELARQRTLQRKNALIAMQRLGRGRVLMLTTDRTWRLRYRVGDLYHHAFWGQIMRWATAEKLRVGSKRLRLGTDRVVYSTGQPITVKAKLLDKLMQGVANAEVIAQVYRDDTLYFEKRLQPVEDSNGMYEAVIGQAAEAGTYKVKLVGQDVRKLLEEEKLADIEAEFAVTAPLTGEMVDLQADSAVPKRMAMLSGGVVVAPNEADELLAKFGQGSESYRERHDKTLWDSWPLLAILLAAMSAEWIMRKKEGLT
jgi:hypothetical protein